MNNDGGLDHFYGRNGEFCVTVALYQDRWHTGAGRYGAGHPADMCRMLYHRRLKGLRKGMGSCTTDLVQAHILLLLLL